MKLSIVRELGSVSPPQDGLPEPLGKVDDVGIREELAQEAAHRFRGRGVGGPEIDEEQVGKCHWYNLWSLDAPSVTGASSRVIIREFPSDP